MRGRLLWMTVCVVAVWRTAAALPINPLPAGQFVGATVVSVTVTAAGQEVRDPQVSSLVEIRVGEPLLATAVRGTIVHLMALGTYLDVRVSGEAGDGGVRVTIEFIPLRDVTRLVFTGTIGLDEQTLRQAVALRFGPMPPLGRSTDIARTLEEVYAEHGYLRASVQPRPLDSPGAEPGDVVFDIQAGARATIRAISYRGSPDDAVARVRTDLALRVGDAYEPLALRGRLASFVASVRKGGFLEARADPFVQIDDTKGSVDLTIAVTRGPRVTIEFAGDPLPERDRETLVPLAKEGSVDQDLLEDSEFRVEGFLRAQGYRDANAEFSRTESGDNLAIKFTVTRGPLFRVSSETLLVNPALQRSDLLSALRLKSGDPFVSARLDADVATITEDFRSRGYTRVAVTASVTPGVRRQGAADVPVAIVVRVDEGPKAVVGQISFDGAHALAETQLARFVQSKVGRAFYQPVVTRDGERLLTEYRNRGYRSAAVETAVEMAPSGTETSVRFVIREGPQILVDHILIVGNTRTSEATIRRELTLSPGAALGDAAVAETQQRLAALGLFRRTTISELPQAGGNLRDVLIAVEEGPATTLGYGGGFELQDIESIELGPRGFVEIGRRNLWGKNRSVNLFGRVSLKHRSASDTSSGSASDTFMEYRMVGSFREPRFLNSKGMLQVAGVAEQGSRTSFRYKHRSARVEFGEAVGRNWRYLAQYAMKKNEIFDDNIAPADRPDIDRLFPQVRISSVAATVVRDTRSDAIDPATGALVSLNGELALRQLQSQVGFAKTFLQAFAYRRIRRRSPVILAGGVRIGLGAGVPRTVSVVNGDGTVTKATVRHIPASERFFAGGDTTVRGFALDRLGARDTFDSDGTPIGGHSEIVLNAETRVAIWRDVGLVGFLDAGNVFSTIANFSLTDLRAGTGFGIRYKSPIGPLRVDFGFKLGNLRTYGTWKEDRFALHISIGQAF
jgi:outer membrane protein insertion porin family